VRARAIAAAALVIAAGLVAAAAPAGAPAGAQVVARAQEGGAPVASLRLPVDGRFALAYRHSYERARAEERYAADARGRGFRLVAIASPDAGVLDYYELAGTRTRRGGTWVLELARPVPFASMALAATAVGRRTLVAGGRRLALFPPRGAAHVSIAIEGS
jgi:hypothetical protein